MIIGVITQEDMVGMCGTSNSLNFRTKVECFSGFTHTARMPGPIINAGRLVLQTTNRDKENMLAW